MAACLSLCVIVFPLRHPEPAKDLLARGTVLRAGVGAGREEILYFVQNDVGVEDGDIPILSRHP